MLLSAIEHRATCRDCFCLEPDRFVFRLRSARGDLAKVTLHHQDKYLPLRFYDSRAEVPMRRLCADRTLDYWEAELTFHVVCLRYWFELTDRDGHTVCYANYEFRDTPPTDTDDMFDCPQNLREEERFLTPAWAANKVVYQVFPARFATSKKVPDRLWYKAPISVRDDLRGDLRGVIDHLDHIKALGVDVLYMTPIFLAQTCHKYDTVDYYRIDPDFGTEKDLIELVEKAHGLGLRVMLDGVFNHTSTEFFAFADIKQQQEKSRYLDWYFIEGFPLRAAWGQKPNFKTFSYFGGMPKLNVRNPEVARYILDVARYWLRTAKIDGWRLDVGDEVGHEFWQTFRRELRRDFPEALLVGEDWHFAPDFLQGNEWDSVMNYPFYRNVNALVARGEIPVSRFVENGNFLRGQLHPRVVPLLWNLIGSHDTPRVLHNCGGDRRKMRLIAALQLLLPGMPMLYYGDEFGMDGGKDPDCRRGMLWDPARQDAATFTWYRRLISARKAYPELLGPDVTDETDDETGLLLRKSAGHTLVFHCKDGETPLERFRGKTDLLSGEAFDGQLRPFDVKLFTD